MWSFFKHHNWPKFNCFDTSAKSDWAPKLHCHCCGSAPGNDLHCAGDCLVSAQLPSRAVLALLNRNTTAKEPGLVFSHCSMHKCDHTQARFVAQTLSYKKAEPGAEDCTLQRAAREGRALCKLLSWVLCSTTAAVAIPSPPDLVVYPIMLQRSLGRETITPNVLGQA